MATRPLGEQTGRRISVEEYLRTAYEPDREYDDGLVVERNLGEFEHAFLQTILATVFQRNTCGLQPLPFSHWRISSFVRAFF
jgi:hypothetical protein